MNTFRRPMFRGGPVDSRGTGITSGLSYNKGGRVGYQPGGTVTGGSLMDRIRSANSLFFNDPARFAPGFDRTQPRTFLGMNIPGTGLALDDTGATIPVPQRNFAEDALFFAGPGKFLKAGGGGLNMIRAGRNFLRGKPSTSKELVPQGYKFGDDFLGDFRRNLGVPGGGIRDIPGVGSLLNLVARNPRKSIAAGTVLGLSDVPGAVLDYLSKEDTQRMLLPGVLERAILGEEEIEKKKDLPTIINNLAASDILNKADKTLKDSKVESKNMEESIDIDKETFAKALGRDKARGQDFADMLLNYAGKATKPGATVQSSFSEFFEEEGKRPSRIRKIDDNAAALAINKYIKGEISRAEMNKLIELNRTKIADQLRMTKDATSLDDVLAAGVKQNIGPSRKSLAVIDYAVNKVLTDEGFTFGGPLPEGEGAEEKISAGVIYVRDSQTQQNAKELITIDPSTNRLVVIKTIF